MKKPWFASFFGGRPTADLMLSLVYKSDAAWNESYWKRPDFDKLLLEARVELDEGKRKQMYHDLQAMIVDDGGEIIPMFNNTLEAGSKKVKGYYQQPTLEMSGLRAAEKVWAGRIGASCLERIALLPPGLNLSSPSFVFSP